MPPKSKSKKMALTTLNKKGKAAKRKQTLTVYSDTEGTTEDEEELALQDLMAKMDTMLTILITRMDGYEKRQSDRVDDTATSHILLYDIRYQCNFGFDCFTKSYGCKQ